MTATTHQDADKKLANDLLIYSRRREVPISLRRLFEFGLDPTDDVLIRGSQYLHNELPVRIAKRVVELDALPHGLSEMPSVRRVRDLYVHSFQDLVNAQHPRTIEEERKFAALMNDIKRRHSNVVPTMAKGIQELKRELSLESDLHIDIHTFLDRFYISRIGMRMLVGQHLAIHEASRAGWVGIICAACPPAEVAQEAYQQARPLCEMHYGRAPELEILGRADLTFTYVWSHLRHMLFELLKNSLRATVETHKSAKRLPPVKVIIAGGHEDVTIKVSDEGGGIPRSGLDKIWSYLYTTAKLPEQNNMPYGPEVDPIAGFGFGLPISRLYARYFGGELSIISMEGYGTDAYLHVSRLGDKAEKLA